MSTSTSEAIETLVDRMPVGVVVWEYEPQRRSLILVYSNAAASALSGVNLVGQEGRPMRDLFPATSDERYAHYVAVALSGESNAPSVRVDDVTTERSTFSVRVMAMAGQRVGVMFLDLVEEANLLARRERRFKALVERNSTEAVTMIDATGRFLFASQSMTAVLGYRPEQLIGVNGLSLVHPDDLASTTAALGWVVAHPGVRHNTQLRLRHGDGSYRLIDVVSVNHLNEPDIEAIVSTFRDITALGEAQRALEQTEAQLRHSQKMEGIGRLAGGIAHDFNNLLTIVLSYTSVLLEDPRLSSGHAELAEIRRAGERAAELTKQLLAFGRKQVLAPRVLNLNQTVKLVSRLLDRILGERIELRFQLEPELRLTKLDPGQIEQVLVNLVVNARDAMPEGGVLTIETSNVALPPFESDSRPHASLGPHVLLTVTDTGVGMSRALLQQIFEPFFTTKESGKGTGLGLSVVHGIVQQSGGFIRVQSEPGVGSSFRLYFPATDATESPAAPLVSSAPSSRAAVERILLVEDDAGVRTAVQSILQRQGYNVLVAADGAEALRLATQSEEIHLLITDVIMPRMTGTQLTAELRKSRPTLKVLFISGYADNSIEHYGLMNVSENYIQKPVSSAALLEKVRGVLES